MASKGPRSKLDHETRAKRHKALEAPKEPRRPKTHWDHVLEEMIWLSKDFESERKWKLAQAKKVALRASKGMLDQATREEKKMKEEEQRLRKVALNISKDVKKFWLKIEKLVLYKHQMELDEKKKKALDKQLEYLIGQTERYSTMLAENLVVTHNPVQTSALKRPSIHYKEGDEKECTELNVEKESSSVDVDEDYDILPEDELEDDEHTIEEDEALITEEERQEELAALHNEIDLPLEELLKRYSTVKVSRETSPEKREDIAEPTLVGEDHIKVSRESSPEKLEDVAEPTSVGEDLIKVSREDKCEDVAEPTLVGEDHSKAKGADVCKIDARSLLTVTGRRCGESNGSLPIPENHKLEGEACQSRSLSDIPRDSDERHTQYDFSDEREDLDFVLATGEEKDDETTLSEEEEWAKADSNDPKDEISLLQKESELPIEELLSRYKKDFIPDDEEDESDYESADSDPLDSPTYQDIEHKQQAVPMDEDDEPSELHSIVHSLSKDEEVGSKIDSEEGKESENIIADAAAAARSAQPTGNTFSTTKVRTKFPFLIKHPLREYQHIGLDWLVTMYEKRLNGILADEMGLGKTIMTIALLAHLACEKGIWGPHLIVVPTSVMLNWETEFLKWCPAFKILTYFGSAKERKFKRQGWMKPNSFHVCITTYRLVIQDAKVFKRKKWKYLILDEAHLIKNWKSQRWQTLLNFNSKRRILLTGTPLQNDLMELWSLMHFLMPHIFQSHQEFKDWFSNPISGMVEGQEKVNKEVIDRLHNVLRPFILRRLKRDVEKQLPMKREHVIYCRLSRRQRNLYEDFIASSETQATLANANFFGMIGVIMQLRKVCNHPDLFEGRPIISSFDMRGIEFQLSSSVCSMLSPAPFSTVDLRGLGLLFTHLDFCMTSWESDEVRAIATPSSLIKEYAAQDNIEEIGPGSKYRKKLHGTSIFEEIQRAILEERIRQAKERAESIAWWNSLRCQKKPTYSATLRDLVTVKHPVYDIHSQKVNSLSYLYSSKLADIVLSPVERFQKMIDQVESFMFAIPAARAPSPVGWCSKTGTSVFQHPAYKEKCSDILLPLLSPIRPAIVRRQVYFPDRRLIQFDCGKLQELAILLRRLKSEGHRALIFTQMTKMLDVLEAFINLYGYTYMRLDGSTQPEQRQTLMQRFNTNPKIFLFILSTRSGGVGINLVGADTVIFYDSDWNPAMDQQAQDRCHRIGQTREVNIYRLISECTIEENILKKANQKRALDDLVIQSGGYNTEFFKKLDPLELFSGHSTLPIKNMQKDKSANDEVQDSVSNADVEAALKNVEDEADYMALKKVEQEEAVDNQEFTEEAIGRLEDDELVNEDDLRVDESADQGVYVSISNRDSGPVLKGSDPNEERVLTLADKEDDADMLADVKQMAAAAAAVAAGQNISSFESQLRPIDHYAIRFLELWDPIIDKAAAESQIRFEETEWELDRIEKLKEDMEAEIDDDEEPLVYERWDADFATEAYRQEVEALTQHQLMEDLECEAREKEDAEDENCDSIKKHIPTDSRSKKKKKTKKAKFKSLKKATLVSEPKAAKEEPSAEPMIPDDEIMVTCSDIPSPPPTIHRKRKKPAEATPDTEEVLFKKKKNKVKKVLTDMALIPNLAEKQHEELKETKTCDSVVDKPVSKNKTGGRISISAMPVKRVLMIKPEKLKKKGNIWSRDCFPSPDAWLPQEDAILCATVHEYGTHWSLVSETLYGMAAGGSFRGKFRHPIHCCERFRELVQRYILSTTDTFNNERIGGNTGSGKALLKVTEDNIQMLLNISTELPDSEFLIQKHFTALMSSVWRVTSRRQRIPPSSRNGFSSGLRLFGSTVNPVSRSVRRDPPEKMNFFNLSQHGKLLAAALREAENCRQSDDDDIIFVSDRRDEALAIPEQLKITLQFPREKDELMIPLPPTVNLSIYGSDPQPSVSKLTGEDEILKNSRFMAESRFRAASRSCVEGCFNWATSAFPTGELRSRSSTSSKSFLGKHKLSSPDSVKQSKSSKMKRTTEHSEMHRELIPMVPLNDPNLKFDMTRDIIQDVFDHNGMENELSERYGFELGLVPHEYAPNLISDLDDWSLLPDYTDIG